MLEKVKIKERNIKDYRNVISDTLFNEIFLLSKELKGLRVIMVNSTSKGGGVAEILSSLVPLMEDVGINVSWHTISAEEEFFNLTKEMHNALQGKNYPLTPQLKEVYKKNMERLSGMIQDMEADVWVIHDPQPMGIIDFLPKNSSSISHIHIDTSHPDKDAWEFISSFLSKYDKIIFSAKEFVPLNFPEEKAEIIHPAIDPLTEKNSLSDPVQARKLLQGFGIDPEKPLISQVSRFDPWKNPSGVIEAYKIAKKKIPGLQLALVGLLLASDDPEAVKVYREVEKEAKGDPDIFLFFNPDRLGNLSVDRFVNAFQTRSEVIIQNSIREGFGLTVSEAMWKQKAVIGGNVGGIKIQIKDGENGFLVSNTEEAAERIINLLKNEGLRTRLGKNAQKTVQENFLIPRLLRDYMLLFKSVV